MSPIRKETGRIPGNRVDGQNGDDVRLLEMIAQSPAVLYSCGPLPDHPTNFISQNVVDQLGYAPADFYADPFFWSKLLHPDDTTNVLLELSRIETQERISYEYRIRHQDGHYLWLHDQIKAVKDPAGRVQRLVGSWFDVSDRKRIEAAMIERSRLVDFGADVRAAFSLKHALPEVLHLCVQAIVQHLNAAFARIWLLNKSENMLELLASAGMYTHLDGRHSRIPLGELKIGLIAQERSPHLTNSVIGDARVDDQEWAKREGMRAFAGFPLLIGQRVVGVMAMFSHEMLTEATLATMSSVSDFIALGVEMRRTEESSRQTERLAAIGTLAAGIAHEINNPITSILLTAQRIFAPTDATKRCEHADQCLGDIVRDGERCQRIVKSVLQFSRTGTTRKLPNEISDIIQQAVHLTRIYVEQNGAILRLDIADGLPTVVVDSGQTEQVLVNLICNAVESGGVGNEVLIRAEAGDNAVRILVIDKGHGMTDEQKSRLFDPFYTTRERDGGTGLGLSIVHGIAQSHGWSINVTSRIGHGTTIRVEIPLDPSPIHL